MPSLENRQENKSENGLQIPGLVQNIDPVEQLSFSDNPATPHPVSQVPQPTERPVLDVAEMDTAHQPAPNFVRVDRSTPSPHSGGWLLPDTQPAPIVTPTPGTALAMPPLRPPVVIKGSNKIRKSPRPPQGRRHVIGIAALVLLILMTVSMLLTVSPLGHDVGFNLKPFNNNSHLIANGQNNNLNLMAQQATATAIIHQQTDGFDPNATGGGAIVTGSPEVWPFGVCTYWANLRYHTLTSVWVTWLGNAYQWVDGASKAGWNVSTRPHVPSIIVLMPGVQGASGYGHVAVVERIINSTTVYTSNMNWYTNGGGYGRVSYNDFNVGPGVYFIWK